MRVRAESGLWATGSVERELPLVTVLEVSGAVLSWTLDADHVREPGPPRIDFTDPLRADWLWRVVGEPGHVRVAAAIESRPGASEAIDLDGIDVAADAIAVPRRLALGHWLRAWWPASVRDGIEPLDRVLLDAEIAVLTAEAQDFFSDDTLDSDVSDLLSPLAAALSHHVRFGDPRVIDLVRRCVDLVDEIGVDSAVYGDDWADLAELFADRPAHAEPATMRQDDYALAAGGGTSGDTAAIAAGTGSLSWGGVPAGTFDAAEGTVEWTVRADPDAVVVVTVAVLPDADPTGVAVSVDAGPFTGAATLGPAGRARIDLVDTAQHRVTDAQAWAHEWSTASVAVGVPVDEAPATRDRVRSFARRRLAEPGPDSFLAEILAAESDY
jgi:hypothetical protein